MRCKARTDYVVFAIGTVPDLVAFNTMLRLDRVMSPAQESGSWTCPELFDAPYAVRYTRCYASLMKRTGFRYKTKVSFTQPGVVTSYRGAGTGSHRQGGGSKRPTRPTLA